MSQSPRRATYSSRSLRDRPSRLAPWLALALTAGIARAAPQTPAGTTDLQVAEPAPGGAAEGRLRLRWDNDSWFSSSDRFYTNGAVIAWTLPEGPAARTASDWLDWLPFRAPRLSATATEFAIAQEMFTPEDIARTDVVPDDRPYAGWLHVDLRHERLLLESSHRHDMLDTWLLQLGVVGPSSLADDVQYQMHEVVGAPRPRGWRNQLRDEPGVVIGFRRDLRMFHDDDALFGLAADLEGHVGANVGNVDTSGRIGAQLRLGHELPRHFGTAIRAAPFPGLRLYGTTGVSGRAVVRDIFLDGNTWRDSHSVSRNEAVADFHVGLHLEPCRWARISVTQVFRTPEFDSPSRSGDLANFTSLQIEILP